MNNISKQDYASAIDTIRKYNEDRLKEPRHEGKKLCNVCASLVRSAVGGACRNCYENNDLVTITNADLSAFSLA